MIQTKVSLIFPTFNEVDNLAKLYEETCAVINKLPDYGFELIFVDDCSTDNTPKFLRQLFEKDQRVKLIRLARNCGSHAAISAGLAECRGSCAIVMAADLQDPPELINLLLEQWKSGAKTVWAVRTERKGETVLRKFAANTYYALMNRLTKVTLPPTGSDVFLIDRVVINAFNGLSSKNTSVFMAIAWLGFPQQKIEYIKEARYKGHSKWTLTKKIKLSIDSLLAFSDVPIRSMSVVGLMTAFLGFCYATFIFWLFINGSPIQGWSSLIVAILVLGGIQMTMLGILGEYLWRTFDETRNRPPYVIEYTLGSIKSDHHANKESLS